MLVFPRIRALVLVTLTQLQCTAFTDDSKQIIVFFLYADWRR